MGKWRYGVILDAGSSGTRVHIYRWLKSDIARSKANETDLQRLPRIETDKKWTKKIHPGISTFGDSPHEVGPDHLDELLNHALEHVPREEVPNTPLFLLATAGMRILEPPKRKAVLKEVCDFARKATKFQLPDCDLHVQVIPGETEGLYGWIAANYLLGGFDKPKEHDHGKGHHTYGFLDMGGASAQIAFAPNATEAAKHANDLTLLRLRTVGGTPMEYKVFVTTWLGFGVNQARQRYVKALLQSSPTAEELPDPCLPSGLKVTTDGKPLDDDEPRIKQPYLIGTGKFTECMHQTYPLLEKEKECPDQPCLVNGQHVPAIDFAVNHFVGVSEYWHTTHEVFEMAHKDKAYDFKTYQQRVQDFCSQDWDDIEALVAKKHWGKKVDKQTAQELCFKASWLINMLHDGIGVPRVGLEEAKGNTNGTKHLLDGAHEKGFLDPFQAVNKIDDVEVSWTLGKMVLYASSEIPPRGEEALAVGFGSNVPGPGLPSDFQHPGGAYTPYTTKAGEEEKWHDTLFAENSRRIPGFLIFVVLVFVIGFVLCGRERRSSAAHKLSRLLSSARHRHHHLHRQRSGKPGSHHARKRGIGRFAMLPGTLFRTRGSRTPSYERVLEDGTAVRDFELGDVGDERYSDGESYSDDSEGSRGSSRVGRTSGWATPQMKAGLPGSAAPAEQYSDGMYGGGIASLHGSKVNVVAQGGGLGLSPPCGGGGGAFGFASAANVNLNAMERGGLMSRTESREKIAVGVGRRSRTGSPSRLLRGKGLG
ncbi:uncharacterized protein EI97DRAFT_64171 [Westerdykella ornata]|uniref:Nucleoside diphosphatase n=1 Tax=Westerdykella ornata TaxID=318751 RepID=A0A6A6JG02_WESOR|nr:uncharacterized protein EI97DRAFT_64171 [Westerdykella ornata]KAF2275560.1 hypothetical protein EI97DRAFT_64171 [Westerdykella ornata]